MEGISQLVNESLARNGIQPRFDHLRLEWSRWFRCESSFSVLLAPAKPGLFALGEEITDAGESLAGKRMLALFQISETDDLGMTLGRLFLPGNPLLERLASGRCFARYTVIEDREQRALACAIFERWLQESVETATGLEHSGADISARENQPSLTAVNDAQPSFSFAWGMEASNGNPQGKIRGPALPSGF